MSRGQERRERLLKVEVELQVLKPFIKGTPERQREKNFPLYIQAQEQVAYNTKRIQSNQTKKRWIKYLSYYERGGRDGGLETAEQLEDCSSQARPSTPVATHNHL